MRNVDDLQAGDTGWIAHYGRYPVQVEFLGPGTDHDHEWPSRGTVYFRQSSRIPNPPPEASR